MKTLKLKANSLIARWYRWGIGYKATQTDICSIIYGCFRGLVKIIVFGVIIGWVLWIMIINPVILYGWIGILTFVACLVFLVMVAGLLVGLCYLTNKAFTSFAYKSWKEKHCTKVEIE